MERKFSGYFAKRVYDTQDASPGNTPPLPLTSTPRHNSTSKPRTFSRTSRANGSAYGYGSAARTRLASNVSQTMAGRRGSLASTLARRRRSTATAANAEDPNERSESSGLNFAQRLLMANENVVTGIADLWVAAAINADNEDVFLSESEGEDDDDLALDDDDDEVSPTRAGRAARSPVRSSLAVHRTSTTSPMRFGSPRRPFGRTDSLTEQTRRASSTVPAIFSHTGVRTPPAVAEPPAPAPQPLLPRDDVEARPRDTLVPIVEHQAQEVFTHPQPAGEPPVETMSEKSPSMFALLPVMVILQ